MVISLSLFLLALSFSNEEISNANKSWSYSSLNFQTHRWNPWDIFHLTQHALLCFPFALGTFSILINMLCFVSHLVWCPVKVHSYCVSGYSAKKIKIQLSLGSLFKDFCSERWFSIVKVLLLSYLPLPIGQLLIAVIALQGAEFLLESSLEGQMWMKTSNVKRNARWWVQCWRKPGKSRGEGFLAGNYIFGWQIL